MNNKLYISFFLINIFVLLTFINLLNSVKLVPQPQYLLLIFGTYGVVNLLVERVGRFLLVRKTFVSFWFINSILNIAIFWIMEQAYPGINFVQTHFNANNTANLLSTPLTISPLLNMVTLGIVCAMMHAIFKYLQNK